MSSSRALFKNSVIYVIGDFLPKGILFFLLPVYTRFLSTSDYGILNAVNPLSQLLTIVFLLGLNGALSRFYFDYKDEDLKKNYIGTVFFSVLLIDLILTIVLLLLGENISKVIFKDVPYHPYVKLMLVNTFFSAVLTIPQALLKVKEKALTFVAISISFTLTNVALIFYFVVYRRMGATGSLTALLLTSSAFGIVYFFTAIYKNIHIKFDMNALKSSLLFGLPLVPYLIGGWILTLSDRIFIERFVSLSQLGIYSLGYLLGSISDYLVTGFVNAYGPFFFSTAENNENARKIFSKIILLFCAGLITVNLLVIMFSREVIQIFTTRQYYSAVYIIPIISSVSVVNGFSYMCTPSLFLMKKSKIMPFTIGGGAVVNIALNILLIPRIGIYGAAAATLISYVVMFFVTYYFAQKAYYISWAWGKISLILAMFVLFAIVALGLSTLNTFWLGITAKILLTLVFVMITVKITGINLGEFKNLFKFRKLDVQ